MSEKKKAVITILGTIGGKFDQKQQKFIFVPKTNKSFYYSNQKIIDIKDDRYINTLPLFIKNFDYDIIPRIIILSSPYIQKE